MIAMATWEVGGKTHDTFGLSLALLEGVLVLKLGTHSDGSLGSVVEKCSLDAGIEEVALVWGLLGVWRMLCDG